jgi:hypothetical protein
VSLRIHSQMTAALVALSSSMTFCLRKALGPNSSLLPPLETSLSERLLYNFEPSHDASRAGNDLSVRVYLPLECSLIILLWRKRWINAYQAKLSYRLLPVFFRTPRVHSSPARAVTESVSGVLLRRNTHTNTGRLKYENNYFCADCFLLGYNTA